MTSRRRPLAPLTLLAVASQLAATQVSSADLTIRVTDISEPAGVVHWALFDSAKAFDGEGVPVIAARSRVTGSTLSATVHDLAPGRYAVRLFHDSNGNGELDRNMLGIPREGYGFSNGAGERGPASFEDAAVSVDGDARIEVRVR
jgi:uncharacterized protein (DUF2141 family)